MERFLRNKEISINMNPENLIIGNDIIKALSVKTRLDLLELIKEKPMTMSDIAEELSLKPSTVSEHLKKLEMAGLVKREDTNRKWKYYYLTPKAKRILSPFETKVVFTLFASLFLVFVSIYEILRNNVKNMLYVKTTFVRNNVAAPVGETVKAFSSSTFNWNIPLLVGIILLVIAISYSILKVRIIKKLENKS